MGIFATFSKERSELFIGKDNELCLDTDELHKNLLRKFKFDMQGATGDSSFLEEYGDDLRALVLPKDKHYHPYRFKARYQYCTYMKRYTRQDEPVSVEERESRSLKGFIKTQERVAKNNRDALKQSSWYIVQDARKTIRAVLGKYDPVRHEELCRFGKRASMGVKFQDSYLDVKAATLTGSQPQISWFASFMRRDNLLSHALIECKSRFTLVKCLMVSTVPKAWDKLRTILKNTTIGAFYTAGLGEYMVERMSETKGLNLSHKAEKHRSVIQEHSITRKYVTTDLSAASDSYWSALMNMLFPRDWYNAMKMGRITATKVGSSRIQMSSFMTMGLGFTFPAQSLAFYALVKAVRDRYGSRGNVSAFGDDLIYPRVIHKYVVDVLSDLGFIVNTDKSFSQEYFRESCGADYYAGIDVRPFQPEGGCTIFQRKLAIPYLYKIYNGWCRRWTPEEIPGVRSYLLDLLWTLHRGPVYQVPMDQPDYSGCKTPYPSFLDARFHRPKWNANGGFTIPTWTLQYKYRKVPVQLVYLWDHLRSPVEGEANKWDDVVDQTTLIWRCATKCRMRRSKCKANCERRELQAHVREKGVPATPVRNLKKLPFWTSVEAL